MSQARAPSFPIINIFTVHDAEILVATRMNDRSVIFFARFCTGMSVSAVGFGLLVLSGWAFHVPSLKTIIPGQVAVKANTAICFILLGLALWLVRKENQAGTRARAISRCLALITGVIGLLSLLEFWTGRNLIDQLLFHAGLDDAPGSVRPGLMSPLTAVSFLGLGIVLASIDLTPRWVKWLQSLCIGIAAIASLFGIQDFILDPRQTHTRISPLTALLLLMMAFALVCSRTRSGLGALLVNESPAGEMSRRLLPAAIFIPLAIAWLRWKGQQTGLYSEWTGLAIMTVSAVVLLAGLTVWTAVALDRMEAKREQVEDSARRLAAMVTSSNDAIIGKTLDGIVTSWNPGAETIYGYSAHDMVGQSMTQIIPPELLNEFQGFLRRLQSGETIRNYETERIRKDGKSVPVSVSISPVKDETGRVVGASSIARDISERKKAEEDLRRAARYSRSLIEASLDPLVTISKEGKITDVNEATEKATGIPRHRLIGSDFCDYFTDPGKARAGYQQVFEKGLVWDYPLAIRNPSGSAMEVLYNATVFKGPNGEVEGVFAAARDITERKRAVDELQLSRERLTLAQNAAHAGTFDWDIQNNVNLWTPEVEAVHGLAPGEFGGKYEDWEAMVLPEDLPAARSCIASSLASGEFAGEWRIRRRNDGEIRWITARAKILYDAHGKPWRMIGLNMDVTERKQAEAALLDSEQKFRTLANSVPQLVWMCTPEGLNVYFNHRWVDYTGLTLEESYGRNWSKPFHPDDQQAAWDAWNHAVATGDTYRIDCRLRAANGDYRWFLIKGVPMCDEDGRIVRWFGTCTDIDDLKRAEGEIRTLNEQLEDRVRQRTAQLESANKELEAFTYSVSHDLRAPLRHISGFSKILVEEFAGNLPSEAQHHLQRIQEGTRRMGQLVDDLLNLGRVGRKEFSRKVAGLRFIVDEVIDSLKPEIGDRHVEWKIGDLPYLECDTALVRQVFQNLLSNALKFTRPRSQAVIEIGQEQRGGQSVVYVRDNGVGFSMKYADKLFGVFQRLHRAEDFEGTGVGLATVQRIIQKHGGRIWAEAELDKGAAFYFTLCAGEANHAAVPACAGKI